MSGAEQSEPGKGLHVPVQNVEAAQALEVVQSLIARSAGRRAYNADPRGAFEEELKRREDLAGKGAAYEKIPENSRRALEALTIEQLALLSQLDQTFIEDGLYVEVPSPGKLFYK
jgi:hypothetical protein